MENRLRAISPRGPPEDVRGNGKSVRGPRRVRPTFVDLDRVDRELQDSDIFEDSVGSTFVYLQGSSETKHEELA